MGDLIISKLTNGRIELDDPVKSSPVSIDPRYEISIAGDKVSIDKKLRTKVGVDDIDKLVRADGTEIFPATLTELYEELRDNFFFDNTSGGGGGTPLIPDDQTADTFGDLPLPASDYDGQYWIVDQPTTTGVWPFRSTTDAGIYKSVSNAWVYRGPDVPSYFIDDILRFTDDGTGNNLGFTLDNLTDNRMATWPDKDGTVAMTSDIPVIPAPTYPQVVATAIDTTELTTLSTTGQVYLNLAAAGLDPGSYEIEAFYIWNHNAANTDFFCELRNFTSLLPPSRHQQEPKDSGGPGPSGSDQRHYTSIKWPVTPVANSVAIDLNFGTTDAADESTIFGAYLILYRVA